MHGGRILTKNRFNDWRIQEDAEETAQGLPGVEGESHGDAEDEETLFGLARTLFDPGV